MTLGERLGEAAAVLADISDTPRLDAEILLARALGISRAKLLGELRQPCTHAIPTFEKLLARRLNHEPIAYILGEWEFFSMPFFCRAPILVPRPETEHLVEVALGYLKQRASSPSKVLDLCTGTGCVAIALARHAPSARVCAVDLNPAAVALAQENAARHGVDVEVLQGDLYAALPKGEEKFDVITANPPYVADDEWDTLPEVITKHEDPLALLSGQEGLDCIRRILLAAPACLRPGGLLAMEIAESQGGGVAALLLQHGFRMVTVHKDLAGLDQIVSGICNGK